MIFITGANGFVGRVLCHKLKEENLNFIAGTREIYGDLKDQKNWVTLLNGVTTIVHLAARVHVMNDKAINPIEEFRILNSRSTLNLAMSAKKMGVKRFIYISTIKVNGEFSNEKSFTSHDLPNPTDPYAISKYEAEVELLKLHEHGIFDVVIIRPPLVYGPGVKANFRKLIKLVELGIPFPFGSIKNKRSLVSVYNLIDLIHVCLKHPMASGKVFLVSDDCDLSLKELILIIGKIKKRNPLLIPFPIFLIKILLIIIGKRNLIDRLFGNLQADITLTKETLNWYPKYSFADSLKESTNA